MSTTRKKLLVDLSKLQRAYYGLWEFSRRFGQALIDSIDHDRWDVTFLVPCHHPYTDTRVRYLPLRWWRRFFSGFNHYDVLHGLSQNTPYLGCKNSRSKYVITLHDLNFIHEKQGISQRRNLREYQRNLPGINHVVFISRFAAQDAFAYLNLGGIKTSVIYNGVFKPEDENRVAPIGLDTQLQGRPFLFLVSTFMRKKSIHLVVNMMKHLPDLCLVVSGRIVHHDYYKEVCKTVEKEGFGNRVIFTGPVTESEKYWLFNNCRAFVFPSQAEGFGIPPIEAMRAGKTVFAARSTSLPEVCGDMAFYWDTFTAEAMAEVVKQGLADENAPQNSAALLKAYAQKYSWKTCVEEYIKVYDSLVK